MGGGGKELRIGVHLSPFGGITRIRFNGYLSPGGAFPLRSQDPDDER
jgi:hypothetical protein